MQVNNVHNKYFLHLPFWPSLLQALGLFGLSAFVIEQRTKEIGIRKVLGASVQQVLLLVSKEFLLLVVIAFIISVPVTWWAMHAWLQDFAYRINIGTGLYLHWQESTQYLIAFFND